MASCGSQTVGKRSPDFQLQAMSTTGDMLHQYWHVEVLDEVRVICCCQFGYVIASMWLAGHMVPVEPARRCIVRSDLKGPLVEYDGYKTPQSAALSGSNSVV